LPNLAGFYFYGRQPATSEAIGIDASEVPEIANFTVGLWGVSQENMLSRTVGRREFFAQMFPKKHLFRLFR